MAWQNKNKGFPFTRKAFTLCCKFLSLLLVRLKKFLHFVFVNHQFFVGILAGDRIFHTFYNLYIIPSWSDVCSPLSYPGVLWYLCHDYLISLWMVYLFKIGLNFFNSNLSGVFFLFFCVTYLEVPGMPLALCSVHSRMICILLPFCFLAMMLPFTI